MPLHELLRSAAGLTGHPLGRKGGPAGWPCWVANHTCLRQRRRQRAKPERADVVDANRLRRVARSQECWAQTLTVTRRNVAGITVVPGLRLVFSRSKSDWSSR